MLATFETPPRVIFRDSLKPVHQRLTDRDRELNAASLRSLGWPVRAEFWIEADHPYWLGLEPRIFKSAEGFYVKFRGFNAEMREKTFDSRAAAEQFVDRLRLTASTGGFVVLTTSYEDFWELDQYWRELYGRAS
jgi:hypothetical protein